MSAITANLLESVWQSLHHSSVADRFSRLRQWCILSNDLYHLSVQRHVLMSADFQRDHAKAILDCTSSMLARNMVSWFAQQPEMAAILVAEPPIFYFRRGV